MQNVDVAIVGGGMVGLALACGLQGSGLRVAVLEQKQPQPVAPDAPPELRVSAINAASEKLLTHLGVWADIVAHRASCYHGMEVWDKDSFGHIAFDDESMGYSHLGHIVENAVIHHALWQKAQQCSDVTLIAPAQIQQVAWGENEAFITLQSGDMLTARLVVGADGANSWLRNKADIPLTYWDYRHHALVATIRTEEPHGGVARQIFHNDGILAFLPLADPHLCSIVWSLVPEKAQLMQEAGLPHADGVRSLPQETLEHLSDSTDLADADACVCNNDHVAVHVTRGLLGRGVRVPEDVALVGIDDVDYVAQQFFHALSQFHGADDGATFRYGASFIADRPGYQFLRRLVDRGLCQRWRSHAGSNRSGRFCDGRASLCIRQHDH